MLNIGALTVPVIAWKWRKIKQILLSSIIQSSIDGLRQQHPKRNKLHAQRVLLADVIEWSAETCHYSCCVPLTLCARYNTCTCLQMPVVWMGKKDSCPIVTSDVIGRKGSSPIMVVWMGKRIPLLSWWCEWGKRIPLLLWCEWGKRIPLLSWWCEWEKGFLSYCGGVNGRKGSSRIMLVWMGKRIPFLSWCEWEKGFFSYHDVAGMGKKWFLSSCGGVNGRKGSSPIMMVHEWENDSSPLVMVWMGKKDSSPIVVVWMGKGFLSYHDRWCEWEKGFLSYHGVNGEKGFLSHRGGVNGEKGFLSYRDGVNGEKGFLSHHGGVNGRKGSSPIVGLQAPFHHV